MGVAWNHVRLGVLRLLPYVLAASIVVSVVVVLRSPNRLNAVVIPAWVVTALAEGGALRLRSGVTDGLGSFRGAPVYGSVVTVSLLSLAVSFGGGLAGGEGGVPGLSESLNAYLVRQWAAGEGSWTFQGPYTASLLSRVHQGIAPRWDFFNGAALIGVAVVVYGLARAWLRDGPAGTEGPSLRGSDHRTSNS